MPPIHPAYLARERQRFMRADAHRFIRPDWRRFVQPGSELAAYYESIERKYRPDQARVPAGDPGGGQWTDEGAGGNATELSAQRRRTPGPREATPGQAARLAIAEAQARQAIARVQEVDPNWKPMPSIYETVEGQITAAQAEVREAEARRAELARVGISPGPYAGESIPARGAERNFTAEERRAINRIGNESGCHTCGTTEPGTRSGNFVPDHQPPSALNRLGRDQRLFPQCLTCSGAQGGWIVNNIRRQ